MNRIAFAFSIILGVYIDWNIFRNHYSPLLIYWWLAVIFLLIVSIWKEIKFKSILRRFTKKKILLILLLILPIIVRVANYNPDRMHPDEIITAYFSAKDDLFFSNFFAGIPRDKTQWVSQFPTPFFALQKIFFSVFGESFLTVRLSILPYVFITILMLYLTVRKIFDEKTAYISVIFYSFLSISLFLETLGLMFVSSTAIFMIFLYFAFCYLRNFSSCFAVLIGITAGFCYLFYITSYIALPILVLIFIIAFIKKRKLHVLQNFIISILSMFIVLSPFLINALKFENYFVSRINQVSLLTGSWSGSPERIQKGEKPINIIKENLITSYRSLYFKDIGGHGGYNFGHLAFFEKYSFYLFTSGFVLSLFFLFTKIEIFFIYILLLLSFLTMALSTPPPAFHRLTLAFPFIAIVSSVPFFLMMKLRIPSYVKYTLVILLLSIYIYNNQKYFIRSIKDDQNFEDFKIAEYILKNYPKRNIYVASFPGFGFEKLYYFYSGGKVKNRISTAYHDYYLANFNPNEKYVYVIIFPNDFNSKFAALDHQGRIIEFGSVFSLFVN